MIDIGDDGRATLEGSHSARIVANSFYGEDITLSDIQFDPSQSTIAFDASSEVQGTGSLFVVSNGTSLRPRNQTDPLAPYGQEISLAYVVGDEINIALGRFRITDVPSAVESARLNPFIVIGSAVELSLSDRFDIVQNDSFLAATAPVITDSVWDEIARISPIPILRSLPDATVPTTLVYQDKYGAIQQLMTVLGGEPALTREGVLTARLSTPWALGADPVATVKGVITRADGMSNALINCVVVTNSNDSTLIGIAQIDDPANPLNVNGPLGRRVSQQQDALATTQAAIDATAATYLRQYSTQQTQIVTVTCLPRWDLELGDVVEIVDPVSDEHIIGAVTSMQSNLDPTAAMTLEITEASS